MVDKFNEIYQVENEEEQKYNFEGVENCVTKNLYKELFSSTDEKQIDEQISHNIDIFSQFVTPERLEIKPSRINSEHIKLACSQLNNLNKFKTPKGKINLLINFCKTLTHMLKETSADGGPDGADTFFPC
mmetsp:Transcript_37778/g.27481  ORF Transcript_37778/g.27481 Transcript_37778/m.27481 type:complete len:130 (-) Transcript_37778:686-1075(-)